MHDDLARVVADLLGGLEGKGDVDVVDDFTYSLPVTAICKILGVPREDEPRFHGWADAVASGRFLDGRSSGAPLYATAIPRACPMAGDTGT